MTKKKLAEMKHEALIDFAWDYYQERWRGWRKFIIAILVLATGIWFAICLSPVAFDLISTDNYSNLDSTILWSGVFIILARALVLVFMMYTVLKIISSEE